MRPIMVDPPLQHCFAPAVRTDTRLLILGSLPGAMSLAAERYYAHPRNQFWRLLETVMEEPLAALDYDDRLARLLERGVGLWDTVAAARRPGSLDADIRLETGSDVTSLAGTLPELRAIAFNGGTAARIGRRQLGGEQGYDLIDLPSSSPALTRPFALKAEAWGVLRPYLRRRTSDEKQKGVA
jgi:hypoxanthine-DNA glycosylase